MLTNKTFCAIITRYLQVWWNWQTRWTQNPVVVIPCGFDSHHLHQTKNSHLLMAVFCLVQLNPSCDGINLLHR